MAQLIDFVGNHYILSGIWIALVVMLVYSYVGAAMSPVKELGTHEATMLMNREDAVVLDIRSAADFKKGHILGAQQLKPEQISQANFNALEKSKDKPIIVVCDMGMTAKRTSAQLLKAGFKNVTVLKGGMNAWQSANLPVAK